MMASKTQKVRLVSTFFMDRVFSPGVFVFYRAEITALRKNDFTKKQKNNFTKK